MKKKYIKFDQTANSNILIYNTPSISWYTQICVILNALVLFRTLDRLSRSMKIRLAATIWRKSSNNNTQQIIVYGIAIEGLVVDIRTCLFLLNNNKIKIIIITIKIIISMILYWLYVAWMFVKSHAAALIIVSCINWFVSLENQLDRVSNEGDCFLFH